MDPTLTWLLTLMGPIESSWAAKLGRYGWQLSLSRDLEVPCNLMKQACLLILLTRCITIRGLDSWVWHFIQILQPMDASLPLTIVIGQSHPAVLVGALAILMWDVIPQSSAMIMVLNHASIKLLYQNILRKVPHQMSLRFAHLDALFRS